jgi:hypothetical protein
VLIGKDDDAIVQKETFEVKTDHEGKAGTQKVISEAGQDAEDAAEEGGAPPAKDVV